MWSPGPALAASACVRLGGSCPETTLEAGALPSAPDGLTPRGVPVPWAAPRGPGWPHLLSSAAGWGEASFLGSFLTLSLGMLAVEGTVAHSFGLCSGHQTGRREASAHARCPVTRMTPACLRLSIATGRDSWSQERSQLAADDLGAILKREHNSVDAWYPLPVGETARQ